MLSILDMAETTQTSNIYKLSLKIMVDVKTKKVVFAEANKYFVDFIFSLMSMPLSTVTKVLLLKEKEMVGISTLYKSIESLEPQCFQGGMFSSSVPNPRPPIDIPLFSIYDRTTAAGYVNKGMVFMVMDNLEVKPLSIAFVKSHLRDICELKEKNVEVGLQEGLAILKASLETSSVLTTVFLNKI